jgi:glycosyltransferase involved in cell wall biosynthesis
MKLIIEKSVTVITPTIGSPKLAMAIEGVQRQTYGNVEHLLVVDGSLEYGFKARESVEDVGDKNPGLITKHIRFIDLPNNTGANGFNGQRIYASIPHLINSDYVFFLDEDNWYEENHVASLVETIEKDNLDWAYSLRKIFTPDNRFVADDNCESLGRWPIWFTHENPQYLVDTSALAFTKKFIQASCHLWHSGPWGEDRRYFYAVKDQSRWDTSGKHTLCYRVDNVDKKYGTLEFFSQGNQKQLEIYKGQYPWLTT